MRATIHQPDFMPWFGFFNKIAKTDVWILLDHVENNPRDAAFWCRRVRILVNGRPAWLSVPLKRPAETGRVGVPIFEMEINSTEKKRLEKSFLTLQMSYGKSKYYKDYSYLLERYFMDEEPSLLKRNLWFIREVMDIFGMQQKIIASSTLGIGSKGTNLLVDLLKAVGADTYICGSGAAGYQQDALFAANNIQLEYNQFEHPIYSQTRAEIFVPGLSIIDALFNVPSSLLVSWVLEE